MKEFSSSSFQQKYILLVYPTNLTVRFYTLQLSNTFIIITNLEGRRILALHPNQLNPVITTANWAAGMYLVSIYEGTKKIAVQQVLK
ncbi:T9SS type A sorting domain-containing protein [Hydrotalea flava]|uniref:T9SS type A sorting domain-containing protein n=1 Tax=Hydrotalea flava TaxID=714549 RepID=UPI00142EB4E2|nr:T9SS type A sorting domain-containing protein [Hydrotalea flava]